MAAKAVSPLFAQAARPGCRRSDDRMNKHDTPSDTFVRRARRAGVVRRVMRRALAAALVFAASIAGTVGMASAETASLRVFFDTDRTSSTGCTATTADGPLSGAELRVTATVDTATRQVIALTMATCTADTFDGESALATMPTPYALSAAEGQFGSDVIEVLAPVTSSAGMTGVRMALDLSSSLGGDALLTTGGTPDGAPIELGFGTSQAPLSSARYVAPPMKQAGVEWSPWGVLALPLLLAGLAWRKPRGRRRPGLGREHGLLAGGLLAALVNCSSSGESTQREAELAVRDATGDGRAGLNLIGLRARWDGSVIALSVDAVVLDALPADGLTAVVADPGAPAAEGIPLVEYQTEESDVVVDDASGVAVLARDLVAVLAADATVADLNALLTREDATLVGAGPVGIANAFVRLRYPAPLEDTLAKSKALELDPLVEVAAPTAVMEGALVTPDENAASAVSPDGACDGLANGGEWRWDVANAGTWGHQVTRVPQMWNLFPRFGGSPAVVTAFYDHRFHPHGDVPLRNQPVTMPLPQGYHGTAMAGIVGARRNTADDSFGIDGINPLADLVAVDTFGIIDFGRLARFLAPGGVDIVNLSIEGRYDFSGRSDYVPFFTEMIDAIGRPFGFIASSYPNVLFVAAATLPPAWPNTGAPQIFETRSNVLVVGSFNPQGGYSVFSPQARNLHAPGESVIVPSRGGQFSVSCGTSISAAFVTGIAGSLKALEPALTTDDIVSLLLSSAQSPLGQAPNQVDAFAAAMEIDRLVPDAPQLRRLLDVDDGSLDGHTRVEPPAPSSPGERSFALIVGPEDAPGPSGLFVSQGIEVQESDYDGNDRRGDGELDMADFRAFRDWLYLAQDASQHLLNGRPSNRQNDANLDGRVDAARPAFDTDIFPRADFNGDGRLSATDAAPVAGPLDAALSDLEVFIEGAELTGSWTDPLYENPRELQALLDSVDVHISARTYFAKYGDTSVLAVAPYDAATGRPLSGWGERRVTLTRDEPDAQITVPVGAEISIASDPVDIEPDRQIVARSIDALVMQSEYRGADFAVDLVRSEISASARIDNPRLEERRPGPRDGESFVDAFLGEPGPGEAEETISFGARGWANAQGTVYAVARTGNLPPGSPSADNTRPTVFSAKARWQKTFVKRDGPNPTYDVKPLRLYVFDGSMFFEYEADARIDIEWRPGSTSEWISAYSSRATIAGSRFINNDPPAFRVVRERHAIDGQAQANGTTERIFELGREKGLRYEKAAYVGSIDIGDLDNGDAFEVRYVLTASVAADPVDAFAYAYIGDPFDFGSGVKIGYGRFGQAAYVLNVDIPGDGTATVNFVPRDGAYTVLYRDDVPVAIVGAGISSITDPNAPPRVEASAYRIDHMLLDQPGDVDGDGIDDLYELAFAFLDPFDADDADLDFDDDGRSNRREYIDGTDPTVPDVVNRPRVAFVDQIVGEGAPVSQAVDLNDDGLRDLLIAPDGFNPLLRGALNDGNGGFGQPRTATVPNLGSISASAVADVNGDDLPDVVVADVNNDRVHVMLGDGLGGFSAAGFLLTGDAPHRVALGDVNGDDEPDILTSNRNDRTVSILLNQGNGAFAPALTQALADSTEPLDLAVSFLDNDTNADLVVASRLGLSLWVYRGNGDGTFGSGIENEGLLDIRALKVADVDGNGTRDIITAHGTPGRVLILSGLGDGLFAPSVGYTTGRIPSDVCVEDIDGDFDPDLMVGHLDEDYHAILLNDGQGGFTPQPPAHTSNVGRCVLIEVTGDSRLDLLTASRGGYFVSENLGQGRFDTRAVVAPPNTFFTRLSVADINGDQRPDVLIPNETGGSVEVIINDGTGQLIYDRSIPVGSRTTALISENLNADTHRDLAVLTRTDPSSPQSVNALHLFYGDGAGGFAAQPPITLPDWALGLHAGDVDGDQQVDLVVRLASRTVVYRNQGGVFTEGAQLALQARQEFFLTDLNADNRADLFAPTTAGDRVFLADGLGGFAEVSSALPGSSATTRFLAVHELNGDQSIDLVGRVTNGDILVYPGTGDGRFGAPTVLAQGFQGSASRLLIADVDGDTIEDIIGGSELRRRRADGTFDPSEFFHAPTYEVVDLDGDNRLDRLAIAPNGQALEVMLQRQTGAGP